jgi:hypothetical protein
LHGTIHGGLRTLHGEGENVKTGDNITHSKGNSNLELLSLKDHAEAHTHVILLRNVFFCETISFDVNGASLRALHSRQICHVALFCVPCHLGATRSSDELSYSSSRYDSVQFLHFLT